LLKSSASLKPSPAAIVDNGAFATATNRFAASQRRRLQSSRMRCRRRSFVFAGTGV
jgi:hypothetical protein